MTLLPNDITIASNGRPLFGSVFTEERPGVGDIYIPGTDYTNGVGDQYGRYNGNWPYADDDTMPVTSGEVYYISCYGPSNVTPSSVIRKASILIRARGIGTMTIDASSATGMDNWLYYPYPAPGSSAVGTFTFSDATNFQDIIIDLPDSLQERRWYDSYSSDWSFISNHMTIDSGSLELSYFGLVMRPYPAVGAGSISLPGNTWESWGTSTDKVKQAGRMKLLVGTAPVTNRPLWVRERTFSDPLGPAKPFNIYNGTSWEPIASMIPVERWNMMIPAGATGTQDDTTPTDPLSTGTFYYTVVGGGAIDDTKHFSVCAYYDVTNGYIFYAQIWDGLTCTANFPFDGRMSGESAAGAQDRMWWGFGYMQVRPGVVAWVVYNGSNASTLKILYVTESAVVSKTVVFTDPNQYPMGNTGVDTQYFMLDNETFLYMQSLSNYPYANLTCVRIPADGSDPYMLWRKTWIDSTPDTVKQWVNEARVPIRILPLPGNRFAIEWAAVSGGVKQSSGYVDPTYGSQYAFSQPSILVYQVSLTDMTEVGSAPSRGATLASDQQVLYVPKALTSLTANRGFGFSTKDFSSYALMPYHMSGNDVVWDPVETIENPATTTDKSIALSQNDGVVTRYKDDVAFGGTGYLHWSGTESTGTDRYNAGAVVVLKTQTDGSYTKYVHVSPANLGFNRYASNDMVIINTKSVGIFGAAMLFWNWLANAGAGNNVSTGGYWINNRSELES